MALAGRPCILDARRPTAPRADVDLGLREIRNLVSIISHYAGSLQRVLRLMQPRLRVLSRCPESATLRPRDLGHRVPWPLSDVIVGRRAALESADLGHLRRQGRWVGDGRQAEIAADMGRSAGRPSARGPHQLDRHWQDLRPALPPGWAETRRAGSRVRFVAASSGPPHDRQPRRPAPARSRSPRAIGRNSRTDADRRTR